MIGGDSLDHLLVAVCLCEQVFEEYGQHFHCDCECTDYSEEDQV